MIYTFPTASEYSTCFKLLAVSPIESHSLFAVVDTLRDHLTAVVKEDSI